MRWSWYFTRPLISELNKIFGIYSFYICLKVMILHFWKLHFNHLLLTRNLHNKVGRKAFLSFSISLGNRQSLVCSVLGLGRGLGSSHCRLTQHTLMLWKWEQVGGGLWVGSFGRGTSASRTTIATVDEVNEEKVACQVIDERN